MNKIDLGQAWSIFDIAQHAELAIAEERHAATDAEVVPGSQPDWYLVETFAGEDVRAMRWLARRRFGVFRPMQQRRRGRDKQLAVQGWEPVFPGWLFVFCWDIGRHRDRILACPGVMGILCDPATQRPMPVDIPDMADDGRSCAWPRSGFIDRLRALAWVYDEAAPAAGGSVRRAAAVGARHVKRAQNRLTVKQRRDLQRLKAEVRAAHIWDQEAWDHANRLDPGQRITLLKRALNGTADVRLLRTTAQS